MTIFLILACFILCLGTFELILILAGASIAGAVLFVLQYLAEFFVWIREKLKYSE